MRPPRKGSGQLLATEAPLCQSRLLTRGSRAGTCCQVPVRIADSPLPLLPLLPCFSTTCFAKVFTLGLLGGGPPSPLDLAWRDRWKTRLELLTQLLKIPGSRVWLQDLVGLAFNFLFLESLQCFEVLLRQLGKPVNNTQKGWRGILGI